MTDRTDAIAREIKRQHEAGEVFSNLRGGFEPTGEAEAYAAQFRLHDLHAADGRGPLGGRKIALASAVQQKLCGVDHPIAGGIFAREIHRSPAELRLSEFHGLGLEFELAAVLGEDIAPGEGPFDARSIRDRIATLHPAFEMIIDRGADYGDLEALTMIADNAWSGGIVLGPEIADWREMEIETTPVALYWNDEPAARAVAGDSDPFGSLAWIASMLSAAGQAMKAGEVVITGSVIRTRVPEVGDQVRYRIGEEAEVSLRIV